MGFVVVGCTDHLGYSLLPLYIALSRFNGINANLEDLDPVLFQSNRLKFFVTLGKRAVSNLYSGQDWLDHDRKNICMNRQHVEIVVFGIKEPAKFMATQRRLHEKLLHFDGCEKSLALQNVDQLLFADIILWRDETSSTHAASNLEPGGEWDWYSEPADDIQFFDHFPVTSEDMALSLSALEEAAVVEVVALKPTDSDRFKVAHHKLHEHYLEAMETITTHIRLDINKSGIAGDINGWASADAPEHAFEQLGTKQDLTAVFSEENESKLFATFTMNRE